jgi:protein gp37
LTTNIEWTDETLNPVTGCSKVSPGCKFCYAERLWPKVDAARVARTGDEPRRFTDVQTYERLETPLRWKKPRHIFVNSMSDLFHDDVDDIFLRNVFAVMAMARQHTFQVLTKRASRMREWVGAGGRAAEVFDYLRNSELGYWAGSAGLPPLSWPLPNVWLGVSVENQDMADQRIPQLLRTPAAVRFLSCEPLLGPIDLHPTWLPCPACRGRGSYLPSLFGRLLRRVRGVHQARPRCRHNNPAGPEGNARSAHRLSHRRRRKR